MWMGNADQDKKEWLELWRQLAPEQRQTALRFARFLVHEQGAPSPAETTPVPVIPLDFPRPPVESAVAGLKRLKKTYPMIETDEKLLGEASRILMGKVLGTPDAKVIDQLETFFATCYQAWKAKQSGINEPAGSAP
ncbi:MAG: hypothetical protein HQL91_12340 [Magnetococcales bacterium]|nr:hypothetical protein [Magnetococcales bacterium]